MNCRRALLVLAFLGAWAAAPADAQVVRRGDRPELAITGALVATSSREERP